MAPEQAPSGHHITLLPKAKDGIADDMEATVRAEIQQLYPNAEVVVHDCFAGYSVKQHEKIILGIHVLEKTNNSSHVLKLGIPSEVQQDYDGFMRCSRGRASLSRVLVPVEKKEISPERVAIIYTDAYQLYADLPDSQGPLSLEEIVRKSVDTGNPEPGSVLRALRHIYTDLYQWLYRGATPDADKALAFYQDKMRKVWEKQPEEDERLTLRRNLLWLFCSLESPDAVDDSTYLDPVEYINWALRDSNAPLEERLPFTLVGRSHGDLHGRNILVGAQRGEAEYPTVYDYGEMAEDNVLVWDFVKLENELKVRLLLDLYEDPEVREEVYGYEGLLGHLRDLKQSQTLAEGAGNATVQASQWIFAHHFEHKLAELTGRLNNIMTPESIQQQQSTFAKNDRLRNALAILLQIRVEAAIFMGKYPHRKKSTDWRDEYYFGLAVYGVSTAKYDYQVYESGFALVSAGVALTQMDRAKKAISDRMAPDGEPVKPFPSYRIPLRYVFKCWKSGDPNQQQGACDFMEAIQDDYKHAWLLQRDYGLNLMALGKQADAEKLFQKLEDPARLYHDYETLQRIAKIYKKKGDAIAEKTKDRKGALSSRAERSYRRALELSIDAFEITDAYYSGINAVTLSFLLGEIELAKDFAQRVKAACQDAPPDHHPFWVLVSEGDSTLILGDWEEALDIYEEALLSLDPDEHGYIYAWVPDLLRCAGRLESESRVPLQKFLKDKFIEDATYDLPGLKEQIQTFLEGMNGENQ